LDEIFLRAKFFHTRPEYGHSRAEDESLFWCDDEFLIFWEDMVHGIDIRHRVVLHDEESISESDIIARRLESCSIKIRNSNISTIDRFTDITVREIHNNE